MKSQQSVGKWAKETTEYLFLQGLINIKMFNTTEPEYKWNMQPEIFHPS